MVNNNEKIKEEREIIGISAKYLADMCLENSEYYKGYTDKDLENACLIFAHFLMDLIWKTNQHLSLEKNQNWLKLPVRLSES